MGKSTGALPRLLLVEDDALEARLIAESLKSLASTQRASTRAEADRLLRKRDFDLVLLDVGLPDGSGFDVQERLRYRGQNPPLVFVTGNDSAESAVAALQAGAAGYVVKRPNYLDKLVQTVSELLNLRSGAESHGTSNGHEMVGASRAIDEVRRRIALQGPLDETVLITGETGTGKELVARALHRASPRANRPFVAVNCAAFSASLFESEFFGSVRGAFTGADRDRAGLLAAADGGTLFLDEVGELPMELQAKLLGVLEDRSYRPVGSDRVRQADFRLLAATNRDLAGAAGQGSFRPDLYYRLSVLHIPVPPLRERSSDIPLLVDHFAGGLACGPYTFEATALDQLLAYSWPGNVRELKHTVTRTLLEAAGAPIARFEIGAEASALAGETERLPTRHGISKDVLVDLLTHHRGRLGPVAQEIEVSVRTLQRRMFELGLRLRDFRPRMSGGGTAARHLANRANRRQQTRQRDTGCRVCASPSPSEALQAPPMALGRSSQLERAWHDTCSSPSCKFGSC